MSACPRCGEETAQGQEYCLECGLRLPGSGQLGFAEDPDRGWARRALVGLVVALAGGAAAVAATGGTVGGGGGQLLTATGGFATTPTTGTLPVSPGTSQTGILDWPAGQDGWTIALASLPQTGGRRAAVVRARDVRRSGLASVGVLDSSRYASLHSGYWIVFTGIFASEAEATSALQPARAVSRTASVRRIVQ
jgi:hypothetical protein